MGLFTASYQLMDIGLLVLRVAVAAVFLTHGITKASFWTGHSLSARSRSFARIMRLLAIMEPICAVFVMAGALARFTAWGLSAVSLGAIYYKIEMLHASFMSTDKTGWEFDVILLAASAALVFAGAGALSIDAMFLGQ